jgi:hypothetical protein
MGTIIATWTIIVEIALTGQHLALDQANEEECRASMARINAGLYTSVTLDIGAKGLVVPIARGIECVPKAGGAGI